jgi:hypothetical protein
MTVLQYYDHRLMLDDLVRRGWRKADLLRAINVDRKKDKQPDLLPDAVNRVLRGESHAGPVVVAIAKVFGKNEAAYRKGKPAAASK